MHKDVIEVEAPKSKTKEKPVEIRKLKTAQQLLSENYPDPKVFVGVGSELPLLVEGTCVLSAKPKLGKSWFALSLCIALANGDDFLGYKTQQCSTVYLDLETSESLQQRRIKKVLNGAPVPPNFYIDGKTNRLEAGFLEQIEEYLKEDPNIGVIVVDVFAVIRTDSKSSRESDYAHAYRDMSPLNDLASKYHISIILVMHDRKAVDADDEFMNILGSTGIQGAAGQMIVMYRRKKGDPIHISVKGKAIDGVPELNAKFENAQWEVVEIASDPDAERQRAIEQYRNSGIRTLVLKVLEGDGKWRGHASDMVVAAASKDYGEYYPAKDIGLFLHKYIGLFLAEDNVRIEILNNGSGGRTYRIWKSTVDNR